jgi:hypothetical protein
MVQLNRGDHAVGHALGADIVVVDVLDVRFVRAGPVEVDRPRAAGVEERGPGRGDLLVALRLGFTGDGDEEIGVALVGGVHSPGVPPLPRHRARSRRPLCHPSPRLLRRRWHDPRFRPRRRRPCVPPVAAPPATPPEPPVWNIPADPPGTAELHLYRRAPPVPAIVPPVPAPTPPVRSIRAAGSATRRPCRRMSRLRRAIPSHPGS